MSAVYSVSKVFALQGGSPSSIPKIHNKKVGAYGCRLVIPALGRRRTEPWQ